jgi:UDP-glucose 4-epimerase
VFLVTGATGFIGRHLVERLSSEGGAVRGLVRPGSPQLLPSNAEPVEADLGDADGLTRAARGCDVLFHLAGKAHDPSASADTFRQVNVEGTRNLLAAATRAGVRRFVFFSSTKAVGEGGESQIEESVEPRPSTAYGISKLEAERLVEAFGDQTGAHVTILRLPLVYGPGVKGNVRRMIRSVARGSFPPPPRVMNRRSMTSVTDAVNAAMLSAQSPAARGRAYFVTDGQAYSTREIYDAMREALGLAPVRWEVPLSLFKAAGHVADTASRLVGRRLPPGQSTLEKLFGSAWYSNERIRRDVGFIPATTLQAALPGIVQAGSQAS